MKIGIVTQPLYRNYGGFLQAWALQEKLRKMSHEPKTIDYLPKATPSWYVLVRSWIKTIILLCIGKRRPFLKRQPAAERPAIFESFVRQNISLTKRVHGYKSNLIKQYNFDAIITGSDQVWRPMYNAHLQDMFLHFVRKPNVNKIAYAASFGVDTWEFTPKQTKVCSRLARKFDAISVREKTGIALCKNHLGVEAIEVLDPTLLHHKEDYEKLCADIPRVTEPFLACYVLDLNQDKQAFVEDIAQQKGLKVRIFSAGKNAKLCIEEWLAIYRDAAFIVTDSFHGTVFSILFHKPFLSIVNEGRGASRFQCLLGQLGLETRLLLATEKNVQIEDISWDGVDLTLNEQRANATDFLKKALK